MQTSTPCDVYLIALLALLLETTCFNKRLAGSCAQWRDRPRLCSFVWYTWVKAIAVRKACCAAFCSFTSGDVQNSSNHQLSSTVVLISSVLLPMLHKPQEPNETGRDSDTCTAHYGQVHVCFVLLIRLCLFRKKMCRQRTSKSPLLAQLSTLCKICTLGRCCSVHILLTRESVQPELCIHRGRMRA